ncbi:MAG: hypothetical protein K1X92_16855 [Bacteroidia bacterium]|nr:hypothetical protein [Bacteroidia bacterium]
MNKQTFFYLSWLLIGIGILLMAGSIYISVQEEHDFVITAAGIACLFAGWGIMRNLKKR